MKFIRRAGATWHGTGKEGKGTMSTQSTALNNTQFSFGSRFEEGVGSSPEELIGAALAGCFSMKLGFLVVAEGLVAESIETSAKVTNDGGVITLIHLDVKAKVPGMSAENFAAAAKNAQDNCTITKSLNSEVTMNATLEA